MFVVWHGQRAGYTTEAYLELLGAQGLTAQQFEEATIHEWTTPEHVLAEHDPVSFSTGYVCSMRADLPADTELCRLCPTCSRCDACRPVRRAQRCSSSTCTCLKFGLLHAADDGNHLANQASMQRLGVIVSEFVQMCCAGGARQHRRERPAGRRPPAGAPRTYACLLGQWSSLCQLAYDKTTQKCIFIAFGGKVEIRMNSTSSFQLLPCRPVPMLSGMIHCRVGPMQTDMPGDVPKTYDPLCCRC